MPLVMVWPAGQEQEPLFWTLSLTCRTFVGSSCAAWLPDPVRLRVTYSGKYANVRAEPPWRKLMAVEDGRRCRGIIVG